MTITFPHVGIYSFDSMNITCQPMDRYVGQIEERKEAKKEKDFAKADAIRGELLEKGILLEDTREGVKWKKA